ncbi:endopeptidase La [Caldinitratiruptor microaerophilus]|uniref:Lon protease n=1 Tax=Caldinitratiruptor microaerophilus TaxID=671077 RepID=A0AA35CLV2_9FIRM|nr:endopeptidase La [Caldinitratiruptor microaerophilus]BDG61522.1 Lon protease [Caldinitratiruptor microaerophilus]
MAAERKPAVREWPLLPLRGQVVFPEMIVPLEVGREKSLKALEEALGRDKRMVLAMQKDTRTDDPTPDEIHRVGTLVEIKQVVKVPGGTMKVVFEGLSRCRVRRYVQESPHFRVEAEEVAEVADPSPEAEALMRAVVGQFEQWVKRSKKAPPEALATVMTITHPGRLADTVAANLPLKVEDRQAVLEAFRVIDRLDLVSEILARENELLDIESRIQSRVRKQMERTQKEYYLREQLKAIQKELGERDDRASEVEEFRKKIAELNLPREIEEKALREVDRLEKMPPMAAESVVVRSYLEWITGLPWNTTTEDRVDLDEAQRILDEDHYGLEKVKERILEHLAVRKLKDKTKGPILCLVGPPGVGKTSLGRSVARALGRKFVRVSLGGVRDEAEIRGHRRTYVGALPGRIIQGMRNAGSKNPVFLLDEIDKLSSDFRGDPASALLEVLDPEQNSQFSDHYIEVPFDLSNVLFITTANVTWTIPRPLLDRMEVITISGYTEEEKVEIARRHLLPKQRQEHGLREDQLDVSENAIRAIIREYTREAGVRNLERRLADLCRKAARQIVQGREGSVRVTQQNLHTFLGAPRYRWGHMEEKDQVGVATGLVVTETGGDTAPVEVTVMKGKGNLLLTGRLGEVMRESAQAGFSYIRSRARELGVDEDFHTRYDIHIHVPEGAIPKDGPSAGITMATAVVSALTGRPVRRDIAMTGEITLRGRVLPVGGVKEKVLAAHRAGILNVILPRDNEKDLEEVPPTIRRKLNLVLVDHMDDVLRHALGDKPEESETVNVTPPVPPGGAEVPLEQPGQLPT